MQHSHPHAHTHTLSRAQMSTHSLGTFNLPHIRYISGFQAGTHEVQERKKKKRNTSEEMSLLKNASSILLLSIVELHFLGAAALLCAQGLVFFFFLSPPSEDSDRTCVFFSSLKKGLCSLLWLICKYIWLPWQPPRKKGFEKFCISFIFCVCSNLQLISHFIFQQTPRPQRYSAMKNPAIGGGGGGVFGVNIEKDVKKN